MAKIKTSELSGQALVWAMMLATGQPADPIVVDGQPQVWRPDDVSARPTLDRDGKPRFLLRGTEPCGLFGNPVEFDWGDVGPLLDELAIELHGPAGGRWAQLERMRQAVDENVKHYHREFGETSLIAAQRCFIRVKLGAEIEVPEVLL